MSEPYFQLPLPIHQFDNDTLENFYAENNQLLLSSLQKNVSHLSQPFFYLWGQRGCGKSHLLKAICHHYLTHQRPALYVPLNKAQYFSPAVLENLEQQELVCLDDLQEVIGNPDWELAIFDLINRIRETGKTLLEVYQLMPLNDQQKIAVLQLAAHQRGIELPDETANFLFKRLERDMKTLFNALEKLDQASLQAQRKLTIPFVKEILSL